MTYDNIRKIETGQGDDFTTDYLLNYPYFKNYYKMIAIDLGKQQALDADPKEIQQINFTANQDRDGNTTIFFLIETLKETILDCLQGTVKVLLMSPYDLARIACVAKVSNRKFFDHTVCSKILFCSIISI